jgi:hypothetical protein
MDKVYYTLDELHADLDVLDQHRSTRKRDSDKVDRKPFFIFGFKCIYNFCETENGWVASHEDCCSYCVHCIVSHNGTKKDKIKFNKNNDLPDKYIIAITKKEIAKKNKIAKKSRKNNSSYKRQQIRKNNITAKELKVALKKIKDSGISTLRRGKKNLYDDIFRYSGKNSKLIYVKGLNSMQFLPVISNGDELHTYIKDEIDRQNKKYELDIKYPNFIK